MRRLSDNQNGGRMTMSRISIIGSGIVGGIVGRGFRRLGHEVVFFDIDSKKVEELSKSGLEATTDLEQAINNTDVSFVCVPTPSTDKGIDLSYIKTAVGNIAKILKVKKGFHTVVIKSTVVPTTTEKVVVPLLEKMSGKKTGKDIGVCMNPEFLTEIDKSWTDDGGFSKDFFSEDRIVIGQFDEKSGKALEELYKPLGKPIFRTSLTTAELIKYASNCALATRISYWNEIYYICEKLGVDSNVVAQIVGMDSRIGKYGTVHQKSFGGKCLPKDLKAFIEAAKSSGENPVLLTSVYDINERIKKDKGVRE